MQENVYKIRNCLFHKTSTEKLCYAEHSTKIVRFASVFFLGGGGLKHTQQNVQLYVLLMPWEIIAYIFVKIQQIKPGYITTG